MKKLVVFFAVLAVLFSIAPALAKKEKSEAQVVSVATPEAKQALMNDVNSIRTFELRVAILQQLLNEEVAKLRGSEESFCGKYKLNVEKFRKGLYRYDDALGKFVEQAPQGEKK
ncbi:MAG: hypothetical protein A3G38_04640 [Omnitrophica WOR_2 bacterium RIFCSPLOWO2_12_FULL_51_8]|nr:MAG: hypothetical protein A3G38_04640 [Omnitrophica WOR_2 bacterium RIFCSPLOWO2_12_FULL_51_8]